MVQACSGKAHEEVRQSVMRIGIMDARLGSPENQGIDNE